MTFVFPGGALCARIVAVFALLSLGCIPTSAQTLDHFTFSTIASPKHVHTPFRIIITARSSTGTTVRTYTGTTTLQAIDSAGTSLTLETVQPLKFTSGQWVGEVVVTKPGDGVTLRVDGGGKTGTSATFDVLPTTFRVVNLPVISLVSDLTRGVLYASVGPTNGAFGTIHVVNPGTGEIIDSHFIPGGVERLEMTKDASKLYVVSEDQIKVRRLRLPDFMEEASFTFGESEPGQPNYARDVAAHPTRADVFAVVKGRRHLFPWYTGITVFGDGPEKTTVHPFIGEATELHWGDSPTRLYGHDNESAPSDFILFDLTETNLNVAASKRNLLTPFHGRIEYRDGKLYCSTGRIIDPENLRLLAELQNGHEDALILPLPHKKRIVYFSPSALGQMLTYDSETLQTLSSDPWPMPRGYWSGVAFWGTRGIAFHDGNRLYLAENAFVPSEDQNADVQVRANATQPSIDVGADHEVTAFVSNAGPNSASAVLIRITAPVDGVLSGAAVVGKNALVTVTDRVASLELASLAAGEEVEVKFTARCNIAAWHPFSIIATSAAIDPDSKNNSALVVLKTQPLPSLDTHVLLKMGTTAAIAERTRGTIFIATTATLAPFGNTITAINPTSGEISQPVWVGMRPSQFAVSDDGKYLFVGFAGVDEVRRYKLPALEHDLTIPLGADGWSGPWFAVDIAVRPGQSSEIAVARSTVASTSNPETGRLGYFHEATDLLADRSQPESVGFASPDRLLAYEDGWGFFNFDVTDQSIAFNGILRDITAGNPRSFEVHDGKIYFAAGGVYNAETGARLGQFNFFGPYGHGPILDPPNNRALVVSRGISQQLVWAFDMNSYSMIGTNVVNASLGTLTDFQRWSSDGLALAGSTGVAIFKTHLLPSAPQELRVAGVTAAAGGVTIQFSNLPAGQYAIEETPDLGGAWTQVGDVFTETTAEIPISSSAARKFYRLVKLQ